MAFRFCTRLPSSSCTQTRCTDVPSRKKIGGQAAHRMTPRRAARKISCRSCRHFLALFRLSRSSPAIRCRRHLLCWGDDQRSLGEPLFMAPASADHAGGIGSETVVPMGPTAVTAICVQWVSSEQGRRRSSPPFEPGSNRHGKLRFDAPFSYSESVERAFDHLHRRASFGVHNAWHERCRHQEIVVLLSDKSSTTCLFCNVLHPSPREVGLPFHIFWSLK